MKGDFSQWNFKSTDNFSGVLQQQGRVLLDSDWNAQTQINQHWQYTAAQDIIGFGVAAIPADTPNAFKVIKAVPNNTNNSVTLTLLPGHAWVDGLLVDLEESCQRIATYLQPPLQDPPGDVKSITKGIRDAVILEVWQESINGFQLPKTLIEPALGGPDTTERVQTSMALKLLRLAEGETCNNIRDKLQDNLNNQGKLKVSLQPTEVIAGDCPVVEGGGYTGFEHNLYRIEIASVDSDAVQFKWSQFNGGLVGRGKFDAKNHLVKITHNFQAITTAGLDSFYLEALQYDPTTPATPGLGFWRVIYGATVTLNGDNKLELPDTPTFGTIPSSSESIFFRLWNGIRLISDFGIAPSGNNPTQLQYGIRLEFDSPTATNYRPGDYWIFPVRAGEIENSQVLIDSQPPQGIRYHRVPLAELNWMGDNRVDIEDCRHIFRPLTNQKVCCTLLVGDGIQSQGDFNSIQEALDHLPPKGGKICLLPGTHRANAVIQNREYIRITGCGIHTIVTPNSKQATDSIFQIQASHDIQIDDLTLVANAGTAIEVVDDRETAIAPKSIYILHNHITALTHAITVQLQEQKAGDNDIWIAQNKIAMLDKPGGDVAIFSNADAVLIEENHIVVIPAPNLEIPDNPSISVFDPCKDVGSSYVSSFPVRQFVQSIFAHVSNIGMITAFNSIPYKTKSGIQIGSGSEQVKIRCNQIIGGSGNGITLGDLPDLNEVDPTFEKSFIYASLKEDTLNIVQESFQSTLYAITIEENTIQSMGLAGIGVPAFFSLERIGLLYRVEDLTIYRNSIINCARQIPGELPETMLRDVGFGGIVLTDCENAIIQENRIEKNGISHLDPICGILILMGEKIDVSNNRILDNGPRTTLTNDNVRRGLRGGIVVNLSFKQIASKVVNEVELLSPDGIPAVKVHDNIVTQPLGQSLIIQAFGPVSVVGNQFTSQGADLRVNPLSLLAGSVFILNLGVSQDLLAFLLLASFRNLAAGNKNQDNLAAARKLLYLPSGNVLFANNQTTLDLRTEEVSSTFSSQLIASLDDVAYNSNQSNCDSLIDVVLTDTALFAPSIRSNNNRFQEGISYTVYSLFSYGFMNTATSNQSTHCLQVLGAEIAEKDNLVLANSYCSRQRQLLNNKFGLVTQA